MASDEEDAFEQDLSPVTMIRLRVGKVPEVARGFVPTVDNMQREVGGYFEFVYQLDPIAVQHICALCGVPRQDIEKKKTELHRLVLACNETARIEEPPQPINALASAVYAGPRWQSRGEPFNIRGDALLIEIN